MEKQLSVVLPDTFAIFDRTHLHLHSRFFIAVTKDAPLYRVTSSYDSLGLTLQSGPNKSDPIVAALQPRGGFLRSKNADIILHNTNDADNGQPLRLERLCRFDIDIPSPDGGEPRTEAFEWRRSGGAAVRALGHGRGYKLVRLATDAVGGGAGGDLATGGGEVVAVLSFVEWSWSKRAVFMFQGAGAAQGVLGEDWRLAAVMSALGIWDHWRRL